MYIASFECGVSVVTKFLPRFPLLLFLWAPLLLLFPGAMKCVRQSLILREYKQPDFSARESGRLLEKVTKHSHVLPINVFGGLC